VDHQNHGDCIRKILHDLRSCGTISAGVRTVAAIILTNSSCASHPDRRGQAIRATCLLIHQKENIKYIQNQLGHSSPMVTVDVYAHLMEPRTKMQPVGSRMEFSVVRIEHGQRADEKWAG
jgi:hypothetical protein